MRVVKCFLAGAAIAALGACEGATDITVENLLGTWNATAYVYSQVNGSEQVDLIASDGASFTMTVEADGTTTSSFDNGQGSTSTDSGSFNVEGTTLTLGGVAYTASLNGDRLTLTADGLQYDVDGDGTEEEATLTITLQRN